MVMFISDQFIYYEAIELLADNVLGSLLKLSPSSSRHKRHYQHPTTRKFSNVYTYILYIYIYIYTEREWINVYSEREAKKSIQWDQGVIKSNITHKIGP